jgi:DNA-binding IclR family transcriptional regulator
LSKTSKQPRIQSITRAIDILRCFSETKELGLTEISRLVGLHKSTAAGIINTLKAENFLEQDRETGKLRLGVELFFLAMNARPALEYISEVHLQKLLKETRETINLAVRDGNEMVYIAKKESPHSMRISTKVGKYLPMYCTAIGKVFLAHLNPKEAEQIIETINFEPFTDKTIVKREQLIASIEHIRKEGIAYDFEELEYGLVCVAAPIFGKNGEPVGAISVSGPSIRMDDATRAEIVPKVFAAASRINEDLSRIEITK